MTHTVEYLLKGERVAGSTVLNASEAMKVARAGMVDNNADSARIRNEAGVTVELVLRVRPVSRRSFI